MTMIYGVSIVGEFREAAIRLREALIYPTSKCIEIPENTAKVVVAKICDFMPTCKCTGSNIEPFPFPLATECDTCGERTCDFCKNHCFNCKRPLCRFCPGPCQDCEDVLREEQNYSDTPTWEHLGFDSYRDMTGGY